jgi:molybdopterin/thiamine biosynthesis adenylyltransferase
MSFLGEGLRWLSSATVTVLGAGGGGSHLAQQIAHLGVQRMPLVDHDLLEDTNVNRVVGANYADVGRPKAEILAERLMSLKTTAIPVVARAEADEGRFWIEQSDVVMGAVDGARARNNIEHICRAALVPYIDIGLKIDVGDDGEVRGIGGQVFTSLPGGPCMWCVGLVTPTALEADREEYVIGRPEQQVVSMNGLLASQAVNALLTLNANYGSRFPCPPLVRYDGLLHEMKPDDYLPATCPHYSLSDAGWCDVLPPRRNAA